MKLTEIESQIIKGRIAAAIQYQEEAWANEEAATSDLYPDRPSRWLALARGRYWEGQRGIDVPRRTSNQILPKLRSKWDALSQGETCFFTKPLIESLEPIKDDAAALLQGIWRAKRFDTPRNRAANDSDLYTYGVVEVGWEWERQGEAHRGQRGEPVVPEDAEPLTLPDGTLLEPQEAQEYESEAEAEAAARMATVEDDAETWGNPSLDDAFIERFCPRDLLVDPNCTCTDLSDARFAFRRKYQYTSRLKADGDLQNTKDLTGTIYSIRDQEKLGIAGADSPEVQADRAMTLIYDGYVFWDKDGDGHEEFLHVIMTDEHDLPLYCEVCPYTDEQGKPLFPVNPFPFRVIAGLVVDNDTFYPESAVDQAEPLQLDYDESASSLNDQRRKSPRQYLTPRGVLNKQAIKKLEAGIDGAIIEVDAALRDQIVPFPHQPIRQELFASMETIPQEIGRQLGVSPYEEATLPTKDMTKAEVMTLANMGGGRTTGDAKRRREFTEDLGMCILILLQQFGDRARTYSMELPNGQTKWGTMRNTDLLGTDSQGNLLPPGIQWRVEVDASAEAPKNKEQDQELKLKLLEITERYAQVPDELGRPMTNPKPVLRMVYEAFDMPNIDAVLTPDPTQEEIDAYQQQRQLEQRMMLAAQSEQAAAQQAQVEGQQAREDAQGQQQMGLEGLKAVAAILGKMPPEVIGQLVNQLTGGGQPQQ